MTTPPAAVIFDLDGVIVDSEHVWDDVREALAAEWGGTYTPDSQRAMMGMSSTEWSQYMHDAVGLAAAPWAINKEVVRRMLARYEAELPLIDGAVDAVRALAGAGMVLGVASSSNRELIEVVLREAGIADVFAVTVSSEEVARGKPSPDVYLETAARLGAAPSACVAIEDSSSGIRAAHAAGMRVIAYPNRHYPPPADVLVLAGTVVDSLAEVPAAVVR